MYTEFVNLQEKLEILKKNRKIYQSNSQILFVKNIHVSVPTYLCIMPINYNYIIHEQYEVFINILPRGNYLKSYKFMVVLDTLCHELFV